MTTTKHAYTAVLIKGGGGFGIGRADEGTKGYTLVPGERFTTHAEAKHRADDMNARLGLTAVEAWEIVAGTMGR